MVLGLNGVVVVVGVEDLRHSSWRELWEMWWVVGWKREVRVLRMAMKVRRGVKVRERRMRVRFWRRWREVGEDALSGISAAGCFCADSSNEVSVYSASFTIESFVQ
jgi:hypothetical protein